jgi:hypothetical protein
MMSARRGPPRKPTLKRRESVAVLKYQLSIQRVSLSSKAGLLNLSRAQLQNDPLGRGAESVESLSALGTQPHLRTLILSETPLCSLDTLPPQPNLRHLIADRSAIDSYGGLSRHPRLASLSLVSTPLAERPLFRLSCIVLVGVHLASINGDPVTIDEKLEATQYPLIARDLIEHGWEIERPLPSSARFKEHVRKFELKIKNVDPDFSNLEAQRYLRPPPAFVPEPLPDTRLPQRGSGKTPEKRKEKGRASDRLSLRAAEIEEQELALQERLRKSLARIRITVETEAEVEDAIRRLAELSCEHLDALRSEPEE